MVKKGESAPKRGGYVHQVDHAAARLDAEPFGAQVLICKQKPQQFLWEPKKGAQVFVLGPK